MKNCIIITLFFIMFFFVGSVPAFAEETGFQFPTTCATNGSSCENMRGEDGIYNSWNVPYQGYMIGTFEHFSVPENAVIDEIEIKLKIRSIGLGPWVPFIQTNKREYHMVGDCVENIVDIYFPESIFNSIDDSTLCWAPDPIDPQATFTGRDLRFSDFRLWLNHTGPTPFTDVDTVLFNIKYHIPSVLDPFLDLPWDYEAKGMSFNDAALAINSFFDHSYPLLGIGKREPLDVSQQVTTFKNDNPDAEYSSHDGYDYGESAMVHYGDPVLAAAAGWAIYDNSCSACGNIIIIDHMNGYQTRYLHLQREGLITATPGHSVWVNDRQMIGKVGATGNVDPPGIAGGHIHFSVYLNDLPTDPFGWQASELDPWEEYSFIYNGQERQGNTSYYLWEKHIDSLIGVIDALGGVLNTGNFTMQFPEESVPGPTTVKMHATPQVQTTISGKRYMSIGPMLSATAHDIYGNLFEGFSSAFSLVVDMARLSLYNVKPGTLSIYSSQDGKTWQKEDTSINSESKTATANIDHFSYFALMGEVADEQSASVSGEVNLVASPQNGNVAVGTPFTVDINVEDGGDPFNAVRSEVSVSSNLSITGVDVSPAESCNLHYVQTPTTDNLSFAGAIFGESSIGCTIYRLTLTPLSPGVGTITFNNASIKAYADASEMLTGVQNASFTITEELITLPELTVTSPIKTYLSSFHLFGTKDAAVTHVFVNDSESNSIYPSSTTWNTAVNLALGTNNFKLRGEDNEGNQTPIVETTVNRHMLGDINGDGAVDLTDASLFAVDWDKTENLTYILSDMNNDGIVNLTDLSILAKLQ